MVKVGFTRDADSGLLGHHPNLLQPWTLSLLIQFFFIYVEPLHNKSSPGPNSRWAGPTYFVTTCEFTAWRSDKFSQVVA